MNEPFEISLTELLGKDMDGFISDAKQIETRTSIEKKNNRNAFLYDLILDNYNPTPLINIIKSCRRRSNSFAIVEQPYFDIDTWNIYSSSLSKCFTPYMRTCIRIHFFSGDDTNASKLCSSLLHGEVKHGGVPIDELGNENIDWLQQDEKISYLGFLVLRPTTSFVVARTAIAFDNNEILKNQKVKRANFHKHEELGGKPFCKTKVWNYSHIIGVTLKVNATPFIQQIPLAGVCAATSAWMVIEVLASRYGLNKYPYNLVGKIAAYADTKNSVIPRNDLIWGDGLTPKQLRDAISEAGATTYQIEPSEMYENPSIAQGLIYTFIESCLPVICELSSITNEGKGTFHTVAIIGHFLVSDPDQLSNMDMAPWLKSRNKEAYPSNKHFFIGMGQRLFYTHNDSYGPFDRLYFLDTKEVSSFSLSSSTKDPCTGKENVLDNNQCRISIGLNPLSNILRTDRLEFFEI